MLKIQPKQHSKFSKKTIIFILENFDTMNNSELAKKLNLTNSQIRGIYRIYGLKRSTGNGRFKKGNMPHNKGLKMPSNIKEKIKHTFYKKGNIPHNTKNNGDIVIRKCKNGDGYKFIRISKNNWALLHRIIYQKHFGDIPDDKIVTFIDGNTMNCMIDNLKLITRSQNLSNNKINHYPEELQILIKTLNQFNKKIKKIDNGKK